ncbi:uncharacterized protein BDW70DRAFT_156360 [Aspergillus foveolatus]|uniref:uncharacterized protein n=1 Tax=Aspergillus foveolatus TaxID=210207 RepID=UPI003CCE16D2
MAQVSHDQVIVMASRLCTLMHRVTATPLTPHHGSQPHPEQPYRHTRILCLVLLALSLVAYVCVGAPLTSAWSDGKNQVTDALTIFEVLEISVIEAQMSRLECHCQVDNITTKPIPEYGLFV